LVQTKVVVAVAAAVAAVQLVLEIWLALTVAITAAVLAAVLRPAIHKPTPVDRAAQVPCVLCGPVLLVLTHQLIRGTCNEFVY
jgi:hypothetical protein